jgi:hypothetical protein
LGIEAPPFFLLIRNAVEILELTNTGIPKATRGSITTTRGAWFGFCWCCLLVKGNSLSAIP